MMGSDVPFLIGDDEPTKLVAASGLSAAQVAAINGDTAEKVLRIK